MPIFYSKSFELRDMWMGKISEHSGLVEVDALQGLSRITLNIIGLAGFNYDFNAIAGGETNELMMAFNELFLTTTFMHALVSKLLQDRIPLLRWILSERKKEALLQEKGDNGSLQSEHVVGRDILSVVVKANMEIKDSEKMTDWSRNQQLYNNLLTLSSAEPSIEELNALPYLDAAIRENLRLNAVASFVIREADRDDVILLSIPIVDQKGVERREVRISNGDSVFVSVLAINRDRTIWGEDAYEFNPER
ncbi:hypothetical protein FRB95_009892 [Tulasnella sp. JGI-2019a]|nr:hypothetical protein FRB95_009892 [Tulasnella sp. JGI-2019a]